MSKRIEPMPVVPINPSNLITEETFLKNLGILPISDGMFLRIIKHIVSGDAIHVACEIEGVNFQSFKVYENSTPQRKRMVKVAKRMRAQMLSEKEISILNKVYSEIDKEQNIAIRAVLLNKINKTMERLQQRDNFEEDIKNKIIKENEKIKKQASEQIKSNQPLQIKLDLTPAKGFNMQETRVDAEGSDEKDQYVNLSEN